MCVQALPLIFFPAVTVRASTRWRSGCCCGCRRSSREWKRERCSAWEDRSTCSSSKPWTPKTLADFSQDGRPGCRLEKSDIREKVQKKKRRSLFWLKKREVGIFIPFCTTLIKLTQQINIRNQAKSQKLLKKTK